MKDKEKQIEICENCKIKENCSHRILVNMEKCKVNECDYFQNISTNKEKQIKIKRGELVDLLNQEQEELQKAKTIEEMAKVLNECCNFYDKNGIHLGNKCNSHDCEYWCDTNYICCSYNKKEATALYNAGYRKLPEDIVVLSREEYEKLKNESIDKLFADDTFFKEEFKANEEYLRKRANRDYIKLIKKQAIKETAEKILKAFEYCNDTTFYAKWLELCKQFDVEIRSNYGRKILYK